MNNLVCAAILPHGDIIPEIGGANSEAMAQTHAAAIEVGRRMADAKPDTIVIATPHGFRVEQQISIGLTEFGAGGLQGPQGSIVVEMPVNQHLAIRIAQEGLRVGISIAACTFGAGAGPASRLPLDWGSVIPLWYCGAQWVPQPQVIVIVPDRSVPDVDLVRFGELISSTATAAGRRIGFIASCDWAHTHDVNGPYGYHADAAKFDLLVLDLIKSGNLAGFGGLDPDFVENAKPDGIWQTLVLAGALQGSSLNVDVLSYQCPTYFGMLVASYT